MKKLLAISLCLGGSLAASISHAADLKAAKFTQVVNDVWVVSNENDTEKFAKVNDLFSMPDLVRTGLASRAELVAADDTITRVGASTIFSFDPANRTIDLQKGSLLFHSPKGKGGGTIRTGSATASVLGTTLTVTTTPNGGFKVIDLEGHVKIKFANGVVEYLEPGQMTFILPGGKPSPVITIRLDDLVKNSLLVNGFNQPLPSWTLILAEIAKQIQLIKSGGAQDTGLLVGDDASSSTVQVIDANSIIPTQGSDEGGGGSGGGSSSPSTTLAINSSPLPSQYAFGSSIAEGSYTFLDGFLAPSNLPNVTLGGGGTLTLNLLPYDNLSNSLGEFAFLVPNGTLTLNNSVTFAGLPSSYTFDLYANAFSFVPGITVEADVASFNLYPQTATTLNDVTIQDLASSGPGGVVPAAVAIGFDFPAGGITITSPAALSLTNGSLINAPHLPVHVAANGISLDDSSVQGSFVDLHSTAGISIADNAGVTALAGNLDILTTGGGGINISGSDLTANAGGLFEGSPTGEIYMDSSSGVITLQNATITAPTVDFASSATGSITVQNTAGTSLITTNTLTLDATSGILLNPATGLPMTINPSGSSPTVTLATGIGPTNSVAVNNVNFGSFATITMESYTINLNNVSFSSGTQVNLTSWFGGTTYGQSSPTTGHINFIGSNNFYNGVPITQANYNSLLYNYIHYSQLFD